MQLAKLQHLDSLCTGPSSLASKGGDAAARACGFELGPVIDVHWRSVPVCTRKLLQRCSIPEGWCAARRIMTEIKAPALKQIMQAPFWPATAVCECLQLTVAD